MLVCIQDISPGVTCWERDIYIYKKKHFKKEACVELRQGYDYGYRTDYLLTSTVWLQCQHSGCPFHVLIPTSYIKCMKIPDLGCTSIRRRIGWFISTHAHTHTEQSSVDTWITFKWINQPVLWSVIKDLQRCSTITESPNKCHKNIWP